MRIFLTGASGFIGRHLIPELTAAGHRVLGLARSDASAQAVAAAGAEVQRGSLEDVRSLQTGAAAADAVIHLGFNHDAADFLQNCEVDKQAIETMGSVLAGSDRPFIATSGLAGLAGPGQLPTEESTIMSNIPFPRVSEQTALAQLSKGVCVSVMRLSQIHDTRKQGLVTFAVQTARAKGVSAYVGNGTSRWAAAHVSDVARLYRLALEKHEAGAKYHAVAEEGVTLREIAETLGRGLKLPVVSITPDEAPGHFGWWGAFAGSGLAASSAMTRKKLGWNPTGPGLIADLENMDYSTV
jgi:nucleoside-diphosphate-sugar epimerase